MCAGERGGYGRGTDGVMRLRASTARELRGGDEESDTTDKKKNMASAFRSAVSILVWHNARQNTLIHIKGFLNHAC